MSIFDKFNGAVNGAALAKDTKELEKNGFGKEVPVGEYYIKIEKMELKECTSEANKGMPMFSAQFRIIEGDCKNSCIFMNQLVSTPFGIHNVNTFLRSLGTDVDVEFNGNYEDYNNMILDVMEDVDKKMEFLLEFGKNNKGYNTYKIKEVFDC